MRSNSMKMIEDETNDLFQIQVGKKFSKAQINIIKTYSQPSVQKFFNLPQFLHPSMQIYTCLKLFDSSNKQILIQKNPVVETNDKECQTDLDDQEKS